MAAAVDRRQPSATAAAGVTTISPPYRIGFLQGALMRQLIAAFTICSSSESGQTGKWARHYTAAGLSLRCGDCGVHLRSVEEAQAHAEATYHTNFTESTEAVFNLFCADRGTCRSQTLRSHCYPGFGRRPCRPAAMPPSRSGSPRKFAHRFPQNHRPP